MINAVYESIKMLLLELERHNIRYLAETIKSYQLIRKKQLNEISNYEFRQSLRI